MSDDAPPPCCRRCEYWLPGTLDRIADAAQGECLCPDSDIDAPPADHCCRHFTEDPNIYERPLGRLSRATRRAMGRG